MLHDRIYARPSIFYITILEKINVLFSFNDFDYLIKSISEYDIIFIMYVSRITDNYFMEFTFSFIRLDDSWGTPIFPWFIGCSVFSIVENKVDDMNEKFK